MISSTTLMIFALQACAILPTAHDQDLVAHYTFDEGSGHTLRDQTGNGNDGKIFGARYVKRADGFCLSFDGADDYVNCGNRPSLNLHDAVTVEAWVHPAHAVAGEPGILGKNFSSFLLTYYTNGNTYWYITDGGNNCRAGLTTGSWHHLAATFDGSMIRLYLDGKLVDSRTSKHAQIKGSGNFTIGCVIRDPSANEPAPGSPAYFPGKVDDVRVYKRALTSGEIAAHYNAKQLQFGMAEFAPVTTGTSIGTPEFSVIVDADGRAQINTAKGGYVAESAYSYPGKSIGWNRLGPDRTGRDQKWTVQVRKSSDRTVDIDAKGAHYVLHRRVTVADDRLTFEDRLTNVAQKPVGVLITHQIVAPQAFTSMMSPNRAENPLIYAAAETDTLGLLAEDDITRRKFEANVGLPRNRIKFSVNELALDKDQTVTMRWTLYVMPAGSGYFYLVNQVRRDWNSINTIEGPMDWFDIGRRADLLKDPQALKAYFQRKRQRLILIMPWLDYDPGSFDRVWPRDEFKQRIQHAAKTIRQANPDAKILGCIETDWVTIHPDKIPNGHQLPSHTGGGSGQVSLTPAQTKILKESGIPFLDSARPDAAGNLILELYGRGGKPQTALAVYPALGNYQYEFLLDQVKFLIDDCGLDGYYIDEFNQSFHHNRRDFSGWDGISAEIDRRTGKIKRRYIDCSLAGIEARVKLCQYALNRGKVVVANTYATSQVEQSLPTYRFAETQSLVNPFAVADGVEPPLVLGMLKGNLASPIGLGVVAQPNNNDTAKTIMKAIVAYLRHGTLFYHYAIRDIPETGPGSGEYGPINHMFPITPIELHKGTIIGKERIITCVTGDYRWNQSTRPTVLLFDLHGRPVDHDIPVTKIEAGWKVSVKLRDWAQIAVIESSE